MPEPTARPTFRIVLLVLVSVSLGLLGLVLWSQRPLPPHRVSENPNTLRVLFIGNSYTFVNNLPGLVIELAAHEAKPVDAEMVVIGGARLADLWAEGSALAAVRRGHWDYVVLQEQSTLGSWVVTNGIDQIGDPALFRQYVRLFNTEIQKVGAKTVLFLTWARQNAPQNQAILTQAYTSIAGELHVTVAPVGLAWQRVLSLNPAFVLHQSDGSHPNSAGSYLAACVFYATFYHKSPEGLPAQIANGLVDDAGNRQYGEVNLNASDALFLQRTAWQVVSAS